MTVGNGAVVLRDVAEYELPGSDLVVYLYNPFSIEVMRKVVARLEAHRRAFAEKKLFDIGPHDDFLSVRAGIQEFTSDFRGFMAVLEAPGVRVFGTLKSSRIDRRRGRQLRLQKCQRPVQRATQHRRRLFRHCRMPHLVRHSFGTRC